MTIVACWVSGQEVQCLADARITFDANRVGVGADVGSKLAVLPIKVWAEHDGKYQVAASHSIGFAFAGSTLIATSTYLRTSGITQMLRAQPEPDLPSIRDIASLLSEVAGVNTREVKSALPKSEPMQSLVFGYCPKLRKNVVYRIDPVIEQGHFTMAVSEVENLAEYPVVIGSGAKLFENIALELTNANMPRSAPEIFVRALRSDEAHAYRIGGVPESMRAGRDGASIDMVLHWSGGQGGQIDEAVLGLRIGKEIGAVGHLGVGFHATEPDYAYRLGERILQDKNILEEELVKRESLRDIAVLEYFADLLYKLEENPRQKIFPRVFYLHEFSPSPGEWCYSGRCGSCGADVPLFTDTSAGKVRHPVIGAELHSTCKRCEQPYRAQSVHAFPVKWPKLLGMNIFR